MHYETNCFPDLFDEFLCGEGNGTVENGLKGLLELVVFFFFFQAMKGEKGIPGVSAGDNLGEELTDDGFSKLLQSAQASDTVQANHASLI